MKVLMVNGSPRKHGNTSRALDEMKSVFVQEGVRTDEVRVGSADIRGCVSCFKCAERGSCIFSDLVNKTAPKLEEADGLVVGVPVYYGNMNATAMAFLQRLFYSTNRIDKTMKVGAGFAVARRGGTSATWDEINKYFAISGMPIANGQYWSGVFGREEGEAARDAEGLQQVRTLARNMTFLMKSVALGKASFGLPEREPFERTNFIR